MKNVTPSKRRVISSDHSSHEVVGECGSLPEGVVNVERNCALRDCLVGTKAAKEVHRVEKVADMAFYKQATTSEVIAAAITRKISVLEDHNLILFMTAPDANGVQIPRSARVHEVTATTGAQEAKKAISC